jgi:hypothetical protein
MNKLIFSLIAGTLLLALATAILPATAQAYLYYQRDYSNYNSYSQQLNYKTNYEGYNYNYAGVKSYSRASQPYYSIYYQNRPAIAGGVNPVLLPQKSCTQALGCTTVYNSHFYVRNALDYTYLRNPELLEPRYMQNNQRIYKGAYPQWFNN